MDGYIIEIRVIEYRNRDAIQIVPVVFYNS